MISRYGIFCEIITIGNFTRVAENFGYSQSAISQSVKTLENELGYTLIERRKDGIRLTKDGEQFYPYILSLYNAEKKLSQKTKEMHDMVGNTITIGSFTGVSRGFLPKIMQLFKKEYPAVSFVLRQGDYSNIEAWIKEGSIDFGFVNELAVSGVETCPLYDEEMKAILSLDHPLEHNAYVSLEELLRYPYILLDEGTYSVPVEACRKSKITLHPSYTVYDDYTIISMVKQNIGVSLLYTNVLKGFENELRILPVSEKPKRTVAMAWRNDVVMSIAAKKFMEYIKKYNPGNEI